MADFLTGFLTGIFAGFVLAQLIRSEYVSWRGWVSKSDNVPAFWISTSVFTIATMLMASLMIYT